MKFDNTLTGTDNGLNGNEKSAACTIILNIAKIIVYSCAERGLIRV
jgi:hypothetical protein